MITKLIFPSRTIKSYAIRKLTPRECFRLMGVREPTINIMQSTLTQARERTKAFDTDKADDDAMAISRASQYKQAGNSIVVDVMMYLFEQLWFPKPVIKSETSLFDCLFPEDVLPTTPPEGHASGEKVVITTFSGYDSQLMACDALRERHPEFRWTCEGWSDIDKSACRMHDLVFPQYADRALGDITKIDWQAVKERLNGREVDLFTYSSPCQDISIAGRQMGLKEGTGTRSALLWNVRDAVKVLRPKYLLQENVAALVSDKFMPDFKRWIDALSDLGYISRWARLNAKNYGVPQNRDRVFCISMRRDVAFDYQFPEPIPLEHLLEDVLEPEVDECYFLRDDAIEKFLRVNNADEAIFLQLSLPPTHEAAMFIKTWLTRYMEENQLWTLSLEKAQSMLKTLSSRLESEYQAFQADHNTQDDDFLQLYNKNMEA